MKFNRDTSWEEVFAGWKEREGSNPAWIEAATRVKGWPDWESWRGFTAAQLKVAERKWQIFDVEEPVNEIPKMLIGPFTAWQTRVSDKNKTSFEEMLVIPEQLDFFSDHDLILSLLQAFPFPTELIGLIRKDIGDIICIDGHHRATALALAKKEGRQIDFGTTPMTLALAELSAEESVLIAEVLKRGSAKESEH